MIETYKPIPEYEGIYEVSDMGNVRSLDRVDSANRRLKGVQFKKDSMSGSGYVFVTLCKNGKTKQFYIHQLIAMAFLGHTPNRFKTVVDHIDNNKTNNVLTNLQLLTNRENSSKNVTGSSKYTGVRKTKYNTYRASIRIDGKKKELGTFKTELEAHYKYQEKLHEITSKTE